MSTTFNSITTTGISFNNPECMVFDKLGNLYVSNLNNNTILKISKNGNGIIFASNSVTSGINMLSPAGLAFDSFGYLYVANRAYSTILKISPSGTSGEIFAPGVTLDSSDRLTFDKSGNLYSLDGYNGVITKINPSGTSSTRFTSPAISGQDLTYSNDLAFDALGYLYVSTTYKIFKISPNGTGVVFATTASSGIAIRGPDGLLFDNLGNLYSAQRDDGRILKFDSNGIGSLVGTTPSNGSMGIVFDSLGFLYAANFRANIISKSTTVINFPPIIICFKENTKILTNNGYRPIQDLKKGDLVKTLRDGFKPITMIGKRSIFHEATKERIKNQLYQCSQNEYPEIFESLVITGCHSILVENSKEVVNEEQIKKVIEINGNIYLTDDKLRLPACVDEKTSVYEIPGNYTIYHLSLEHNDYLMNYGIYANGLLVETCSERNLKELSTMELIL